MEPAFVQTRSDLAKCLDVTRRLAGWTYRKIDREREKNPVGEILPRSTVNDLCNGKGELTRQKLAEFLGMCQLNGEGAEPYLQAWDRVYESNAGRLRNARRVRDCQPLRLGVHTPIHVPNAQGELSTYVGRDVDDEIRRLLNQGASGGGCFVLLVGGSSVGKTRTAFEALAAEFSHWWLVQPANQADLEALAADPGRNTVVWLDEIQQMLTKGLTAGTVRALLAAEHPVLLVGTIWPGQFQQFKAPPSGDRTHDPNADHRDVLRLATVVRLSETLSAAETDRASEAAITDVRLAATLTSRYGMIRALAAVPALLDRWEGVPNSLSRTIITAAVDAVRLGVQGALPIGLLKNAIVDDLTPGERADATPREWEAALEYTTEKLDGAARVLEPVGTELGGTDGYRIADFLLEHIGRARSGSVPPVSAWEAYCRHVTDSEDLYRLGFAAEQRMLLSYAERLYRSAGTADSYYTLAFILFRQDRVDEAMEAWGRALTLESDPYMVDHLAEELDAMGWPNILESILRKAWARGDINAFHELTARLDGWDRGDEADQLIREAAEAGVSGAATTYTLRCGDPKSPETEQLLRRAMRNGEPLATDQLGQLLTDLGRLEDVEQLWRDAITQGESGARLELADLLMRQDRQDEVEALWRAGTRIGEPSAWSELVSFFREYERFAEAEQAWHDASAASHPQSMEELVELIVAQGWLSEAEELVGELIEKGEAPARLGAEILQLQDRSSELEAFWQNRLAVGDPDAVGRLGDLLKAEGRKADLEQLWRDHIDRRGTGLDTWMALLAGQNRDDEIESLLRQRAALGNDVARILLTKMLEEQSRFEDAEQVYRDAAIAGQVENMEFAFFYKRHSNLNEAERLLRKAVASGEHAAWWGLITIVAEGRRFAEARQLKRFGLNPDGSLASPNQTPPAHPPTSQLRHLREEPAGSCGL